MFIYDLNYPVHHKFGQSIFSNVMFGLGVKDIYDLPAILGGNIVGRLGDYVDEAKLVFKAFLEVFLRR